VECSVKPGQACGIAPKRLDPRPRRQLAKLAHLRSIHPAACNVLDRQACATRVQQSLDGADPRVHEPTFDASDGGLSDSGQACQLALADSGSSSGLAERLRAGHGRMIAFSLSAKPDAWVERALDRRSAGRMASATRARVQGLT